MPENLAADDMTLASLEPVKLIYEDFLFIGSIRLPLHDVLLVRLHVEGRLNHI